MTVAVAKGLFNRLRRPARPDVIVAELGDGILGEYGVQDILRDPELMRRRRRVRHGRARSGRPAGARPSCMRQRVRPADHRDHRTRHRQRGRPRLHRGALGLPAHNALRDARRAGRAWCATPVDRAGQAGTTSATVARVKVAVIGAAGYVGGELLRLLLQHPEVTRVGRRPAGARRASRSADVHPALAALTDARFSRRIAGRGGARDATWSFSALEHGESSRVAGEVFDAGPGLVVDLAADFRMQRSPRSTSATTARTRRPSWCTASPTGWPTCSGAELRGATAIAAPGCFATAAQLALYPLAGLALASPPSLFAVTGSSGAGVQPKPTTHHPMRAHNLFAYSVLGHRHEAEVLRAVARVDRPAGRHGAADDPLRARSCGASTSRCTPRWPTAVAPAAAIGRRWYRGAYAGRPFVRVLDAPPELTHAVGTNDALLHAVAERRRPRGAGDASRSTT